jgi:NAD(P)-dependent dehydrogenase (short-subunit alcohol dehydrogenase family)
MLLRPIRLSRKTRSPRPNRAFFAFRVGKAMTSQPLLGKSALVTGGARRIGREIALALAKAGADVAITYRTSSAEAAGTAREIESLGCRALAVECDVRSEASVREAIAATIGSFERLDVVVNNAAVFHSAPLDQISLDQWDAVFETNTRGPFLVAREALPALRALMAGSSTSARSEASTPGPATETTVPPRPRCTCLPRPWPRRLHPR